MKSVDEPFSAAQISIYKEVIFIEKCRIFREGRKKSYLGDGGGGEEAKYTNKC